MKTLQQQQKPDRSFGATEAASPAIQHTDIPVGLRKTKRTSYRLQFLKIIETKTNIGGDRFSFAKFGRPFNAIPWLALFRDRYREYPCLPG
ncbi:MAG: hypothetical protein IPJ31_11980 [Bacteroidetes bacterium]|nr:hypothetical protein [Bacteroidota bacterium]